MSRRLALVVALAGLAGCYSPPPETKLALTVMADGQLSLDGRPLSLDELRQALAARAGPRYSTLLVIHAAPAVAMPAIQQLVGVAKQTGTAVAFAAAGPAP